MADDKRREQAERPAARPEPQPEPRHIADDPVPDPDAADATVQSPITETGLPVEEQVHKEWDTNRDGGLPTPLRVPLRDAAR
jgi:hypothetical protein